MKALDEKRIILKEISNADKNYWKNKFANEKERDEKYKQAYINAEKKTSNYSKEHSTSWCTTVDTCNRAYKLYIQGWELFMQLAKLEASYHYYVDGKNTTTYFELILETLEPYQKNEYQSVKIFLKRIHPDYIDGRLELYINDVLIKHIESPYFMVLQYNLFIYIEKARNECPTLFAQNENESRKYISVENKTINLFF
jgi:hypothetical protein